MYLRTETAKIDVTLSGIEESITSIASALADPSSSKLVSDLLTPAGRASTRAKAGEGKLKAVSEKLKSD